MNSITESEMLKLALNAAENANGKVWEVMGCYGELVPIAAFSQHEFAQLMALYLRDPGDPFDIDDFSEEPVIDPVEKDSTELQIDRYLPELKAGKLPFEIVLRKNGRLLKAGRADSIFDPEITDYFGVDFIDKIPVQIKTKSVYGVYWAYSKEEAIQQAELYVHTLNEQGAFN